jgi:CRISPR-associated protein (TIGR03986 family)
MSKWPEHKNPRPDRAAKAPYNFVPLPEKVVTVNASDLPDRDSFDPKRYTGWIVCNLTTESPLYVRAALEPEEFQRPEEVDQELDWEDQVRNKPDFYYTEDRDHPVIPGSSLRGMLRSLLEIVGYGKMQWVTDQQRYFFRAVAAPRSDPLRDPYREVIGSFSKNVKAGYLLQRGDDWYVIPAISPQSRGWPEQGAFLKVKEHQVLKGAVPGYVDLNDPHYHPQWHDVSFDVEVKHGKHGPYAWISHIGPTVAGYANKGVLVCSGNMRETNDSGKLSPRKSHAVLLMPKKGATPIKIKPTAVRDYLAGLTPFQKEELGAWGGRQRGCLNQGAPVFYVTDGKEVVSFGHSPNFRIPFQNATSERAACPLDYVPEALRREMDIDLAEAVFGFAKAHGEGKERAYAGRVFITDGKLCADQDQVWLATNHHIVPKILGSPKPTTFQHYLVQTSANDSARLRHYGSETPDDTLIRGHKLYWHKGDVGIDDIQEEEPEKNHDSQHTQIRPVRPGVTFQFRIYFEEMSAVELGAVLWILDKASGDKYRLSLGMGKPYGMGAVRIEPSLFITTRTERYKKLFQDRNWADATTPGDSIIPAAINEFERVILSDSTLNPRGAQELEDVDRIRALLNLLSWPGPDRNRTRYLLIKHPQNGNEYRDRSILPDPPSVLAGQRVQPPTPQRQPEPAPPPSDHPPTQAPHHTAQRAAIQTKTPAPRPKEPPQHEVPPATKPGPERPQPP